ncbi:PASTA domain-containing protein [Erysipelothrix sp. D19-032]
MKVPDFKGKTKTDVEAWYKDKKFISEFVYEEGYDDKLEVGMIISGGNDSDTQVGKDDVLTFVVSKGKAIYVPDFSQISMGEFKENPPTGVNAMLKEWYSGYAYGTFLEQSIPAGTNIAGTQDASVKVYYSIGKPYVGDLVGMKENDLASLISMHLEIAAQILVTLSHMCRLPDAKRKVR